MTNTAGVTVAASITVLSSPPGDSTVLVVVDAAVVLVVVVDAAVVLVVVTAAVVVDAPTVVLDAAVVEVLVDASHSGLATVTWPDTTSFGVIEAQRATTTKVADPVEAPKVDVPVADAPGATLLGLSDIATPFTFAESKVMMSPAAVSLLPTVQWTVQPPVSIQLG